MPAVWLHDRRALTWRSNPAWLAAAGALVVRRAAVRRDGRGRLLFMRQQGTPTPWETRPITHPEAVFWPRLSRPGICIPLGVIVRLYVPSVRSERLF